jgi:hypothetical protein
LGAVVIFPAPILKAQEASIVPESPIRRVALLMHEAYGSRATEEAISRAIEYRAEGDEIGFDVWSSVAVALGQPD